MDTNEMIDKLNEHIREIQPDQIWIGYSGGKDSSILADLVTRAGVVNNVILLDTGTAIKETIHHCEDQANRYNWNFETEKTKQKYNDIVLGKVRGYSGGFPSGPMHSVFQNRLKDRAISAFKKRAKIKYHDRFLILTGIRQTESKKRLGYNSPASRTKQFFWYNPIFYMDNKSVYPYLKDRDIKINPVSKILGISGECLCGAYAPKGEKELIKQFYPERGDWIEWLEKKVKAAGFPWGWDDPIPKWWKGYKAGQAFLPGLEPDNISPLCNNCHAKHHRACHSAPGRTVRP